MRTLVLVLQIGAVACAADKPPARSGPGAEVAAPAGELAEPAPGAEATGMSAPPATGAQQYVGLRSADLLLE